MRESPPFEFPKEQDEALRKARWLEWGMIIYLFIDLILLYLVMGSSQAMKAAWVEDLLALIPPIAFLVGTRIAVWPPNDRFPYGYHRVVSIGFFFAALALLGLGGYILVDSVISLVEGRHPTISALRLFGWEIWLGWLMIAVLIFSSMIPPMIIGRLKVPLAETMHDKVLYSDADMNKAAWLSAGAAVLGVLGIGFGLWWADSVAAIVIGLDIVRDGYRNTREVISNLMDEVPKTTGFQRIDPVIDRLADYLKQLDWVEHVDVRLREQGHVYFGEAFVVPKDEANLIDRIEKALDGILRLDWRMYDFAIVPVRSIERERETGLRR